MGWEDAWGEWDFPAFGRLAPELARALPVWGDGWEADLPPVALWTGPEGAVVRAELPGVSAGEVEVTVLGDTLTIKGTRKAEEAGEGDTVLRRERWSGPFSRGIRLPFKAEPGKAAASFRRGILTVEIPRAEADKPRRIAVKAG